MAGSTSSSFRSARLVGLVLVALLAGAGAWYVARERLVAPPPPEAAPPVIDSIARFVSTEGRVDLKPAGTLEWNGAALEDPLRRQDMVRTGAGGLAEIRFFEGARLQLRPESLVTIEEGAQDPATDRRRVAWRISQGEASFQTASRTLNVVSTPSLTARPGDNADVSIQVAGSGEVQMRVFRGSSEIETKEGRSVSVTAGEAVSVDAAGAIGEKRELLPAPPLESPPAEALVSYPEPERAATLLEWERVPGGRTYRVMLARDPEFAEPLLDPPPGTAASYVVRRLGLGDYWWRVAAIDESGFEGHYSEIRMLRVAESGGQGFGPPPPLRISEIESLQGVLRVSGVTEHGARITVNGVVAGSVPGERFDEFFILGPLPGPEIEIRSESVNGGVTVIARRVPGS